jgi:small subunit ribosomal protein S2
MSDLTLIDGLFKAGSHYGYSKTRRHPSTAKYIYGTKNKVDIIDIEKTATGLEKAQAFLNELGAKGKTVLFVGVKPEAREAVRHNAEIIGMPFIAERWAGGVLTNFPEIKKRVAKLEDLRTKRENGDLEKYTKKERILIDEEIAQMHRLFSGIVGMKKLPDALVIVDPKREYIAAAEAVHLGIPVIAIANTDNDISTIEYPIVANDGSVASVSFILQSLASAYRAPVTTTIVKEDN